MQAQATEAANRNMNQAMDQVREQTERRDRESFGREVAAEATEQREKVDKETFGAQVVSKTMDYMNEDSTGATDSDYDFQERVLSGHFTGKGTIMDTLI